jgi:hypothetical protein
VNVPGAEFAEVLKRHVEITQLANHDLHLNHVQLFGFDAHRSFPARRRWDDEFLEERAHPADVKVVVACVW